MAMIVPAMFGVGYAPRPACSWVAVAFLVLFGLGWGFFDCNNMPILCQIAGPELRATGYGIMNLVSISCGGFADWGFGMMRDRHVPLFGIFGVFASAARALDVAGAVDPAEGDRPTIAQIRPLPRSPCPPVRSSPFAALARERPEVVTPNPTHHERNPHGVCITGTTGEFHADPARDARALRRHGGPWSRRLTVMARVGGNALDDAGRWH